jgi:hypothetical protein
MAEKLRTDLRKLSLACEVLMLSGKAHLESSTVILVLDLKCVLDWSGAWVGVVDVCARRAPGQDV